MQKMSSIGFLPPPEMLAYGTTPIQSTPICNLAVDYKVKPLIYLYVITWPCLPVGNNPTLQPYIINMLTFSSASACLLETSLQ